MNQTTVILGVAAVSVLVGIGTLLKKRSKKSHS